MKNIYTLCIAAFMICACSLNSSATKIIINVEDFEFSPSIFTISAGDTIMWMWDNSAGAHTTTSTNIPATAIAWNAQINSSAVMFSYVPTVLGDYDYICSFHSAMGMVGHFTVIGGTGEGAIPSAASMSFTANNFSAHQLQLTYTIPATTELNIRLYDILGKEVSTFFSSNQISGTYSQTFDVPALSKGIYVLSLETATAMVSKKVLVQ